MSALVFIGVLLSVVWGLHRLVQLLTHDAVADARLRELQRELELAARQAKAEQAAEKMYKEDKTDGAFDQEFRRD